LQGQEAASWEGDCLDGAPVPDNGSWWHSEPDVGRVANGVAHRVDRLRCLGNGQVPAVVRFAWETLTNGIGEG
jgi:DNA (cytosine-5)-methyltransferase 1